MLLIWWVLVRWDVVECVGSRGREHRLGVERGGRWRGPGSLGRGREGGGEGGEEMGLWGVWRRAGGLQGGEKGLREEEIWIEKRRG